MNRFIGEITELISTYKKSQHNLITTLNRKLKSRAGYHCCTDALPAFSKVDNAVQTTLFDLAVKKHPKLPTKKVISKYWYEEANGQHCYALPNDKTIRVVRIAETMLIVHRRSGISMNPFPDLKIFLVTE